MSLRLILPAACLTLAFLAGCSREPAEDPYPVHAYLEGQLSVRADVDSVADYRGFEILVINPSDSSDADTLGHAVTDSTGAFAMDVRAPERGIYQLLVSRRGTLLKRDQLVVADGDSAVLRATFPAGNRPLTIRSPENAAWMAYRNTKAQHDQRVFRLIQDEAFDRETFERSVQQTAGILWGMRDSYAGTIGGDLATAEAILMLEGVDDSLLVERARQVEPTTLNFAEVARAARRAEARRQGPAEGLALLQDLMQKTTDPAQQAALHSELVIAHMEAGEADAAREAARNLMVRFPDSPWAPWAERALYDFENLMPGQPAPAFTATTVQGDTLRLADLRGRIVLLEFYRPENATYQRELSARNALYEATPDTAFALVSISLQPDALLNEAFAEGRPFPGRHVWAPQGTDSELARQYNVSILPRRLLLDREGRILSRYEGASIGRIQEEVATLLNPTPDDQPPS